MNRSGEAVAALARYYDIAAGDILVVVDEVALPFGRLRARARGSAGGHNGLKSLDRPARHDGISPASAGGRTRRRRRDLADHVLATFEAGERAGLDDLITRAADAAEMFAAEGIEEGDERAC